MCKMITMSDAEDTEKQIPYAYHEVKRQDREQEDSEREDGRANWTTYTTINHPFVGGATLAEVYLSVNVNP